MKILFGKYVIGIVLYIYIIEIAAVYVFLNFSLKIIKIE